MKEFLTPTRLSAILAAIIGVGIVVIGYSIGDDTLRTIGYGIIGGSGLTAALPPTPTPKDTPHV